MHLTQHSLKVFPSRTNLYVSTLWSGRRCWHLYNNTKQKIILFIHQITNNQSLPDGMEQSQNLHNRGMLPNRLMILKYVTNEIIRYVFWSIYNIWIVIVWMGLSFKWNANFDINYVIENWPLIVSLTHVIVSLNGSHKQRFLETFPFPFPSRFCHCP